MRNTPYTMVQITCDAQTPSDTHHTASAVASLTISAPKHLALRIARAIERHTADNGAEPYLERLRTLAKAQGHTLATGGFGTLISYPSGRNLYVRRNHQNWFNSKKRYT